MVDIDLFDVLHPEVIRRKQVVATLAAGPRMTSPDESHGRQGQSQTFPGAGISLQSFYGMIVGTSPPSAPNARPVVAEAKSDER